MLVGILKPFRNMHYSALDVYKQILDYNGIDYIDLDINSNSFWSEIKNLNLFLAKIAHNDNDLALAAQIIPIINLFLNIPSFPDYNTVWHYDDKVKQYYLLKSMDFPVIDSYVYWDKIEALKWAENTSYPVVFKLKGGAGSANVKLVKSYKQAKSLIKKSFGRGIHPYFFDLPGKFKAFNCDKKRLIKYLIKPTYYQITGKASPFINYNRHKNYVYFQKFLPDNKYDTRVCILGERAYAFKRFVRKNDFRASGSNYYDMDRNTIDKNMIKIAFDISTKLNFQSMAYDFIYDENKNPLIAEISYTYGDYPEFSNGYWDKNLIWHSGHYFPEYFELVDALHMPELKLPHIEINSPYKKAKMLNKN